MGIVDEMQSLKNYSAIYVLWRGAEQSVRVFQLVAHCQQPGQVSCTVYQAVGYLEALQVREQPRQVVVEVYPRILERQVHHFVCHWVVWRSQCEQVIPVVGVRRKARTVPHSPIVAVMAVAGSRTVCAG